MAEGLLDDSVDAADQFPVPVLGGVAVVGAALGLVGTRVPLRSLKDTLGEATPSLLAGTVAGAAVLIVGRTLRPPRPGS